MIIDKISGSRVRFDVTVSKELFEHALDHAFEKVNKNVEIKGFRKGHAPRAVYEAKYGVESLYEEAVNHALQDTYFDIISEQNLQVVAQPKINLEFDKIKRGQDFSYEVIVAVKPEVLLGEYKGITLPQLDLAVTEAEVDAEINRALDQHAELSLKEEGTIEQGNTVVFDFSGSVNGEKFEGGTSENYELVIGSGQFIPGFEDQMVGLAIGSEADLTVVFPESYHEASLAGKEAVFHVKIHEIKQRIVPALDDEFVQELNLEGISTVEAYKTHVVTTLESQKQTREKQNTMNLAIQKVVDQSQFDLPEEMVQEEVQKMKENQERQIKGYGLDFNTYLQYMGKTMESFMEDLKKEATSQLRAQLVIEAVGKKENFEISDEEEIGRAHV